MLFRSTGYNSALGLAVITQKVSNIPISSRVANSSNNIIFLSYGTKLGFLPGLYKRPFFKRLGVGLSIKGLMSQTLRETGLPDRSATGWDIDVGALWKGGEWWSAGVTLQNLLPAKALGGGEIVWDVGSREGFPAVGRIGAAARVIGDIGSPIFREGQELLIAGELSFSTAHPTLLRLGGEWKFREHFYLRSGLMQQRGITGTTSDLNLGFGYREERWGADLTTYRQPFSDQRVTYFSILYFPKDWIVVKQLNVPKPAVVLEDAIKKL